MSLAIRCWQLTCLRHSGLLLWNRVLGCVRHPVGVRAAALVYAMISFTILHVMDNLSMLSM